MVSVPRRLVDVFVDDLDRTGGGHTMKNSANYKRLARGIERWVVKLI